MREQRLIIPRHQDEPLLNCIIREIAAHFANKEIKVVCDVNAQGFIPYEEFFLTKSFPNYPESLFNKIVYSSSLSRSISIVLVHQNFC